MISGRMYYEPKMPWQMNLQASVARQEIMQYNLVKVVADTLSKTGLDPSCLELELTEGSIMENVEEATSIMHAIKRMGVELSVDDFGTGYSSLSYLKRFPIDKLNIDSSYVNGIPNDPGNTGITLAIIAMSRSLKLDVVAEGVETTEQLNFLRDQGCENIQGFFVSTPLLSGELPAFLTRYNRPCQ
jgi:EAL domain-containing protein (putative c-di-GMP-specific phosphodiesterase class I)